MTRVRHAVGRTFSSLRIRNYRLFFFGQIVSVTGTWMQSLAQAWLVLDLTNNSSVALGEVIGLQFVPMLLAGAWGGVVADRFDKRRILVATQSAAATLALTLGVLAATHAVRLWMVFLLAFMLGIVNLFDMPTRQAFVTEIVGPDRVANAVSLNSVVVNSGRIVGPAVAGILIAKYHVPVCFIINAISYLAVIAGLLLMRRSELLTPAPVPRRKGQLREGLRYAWSDPQLRRPLLLVGVVGLLIFNFSVFLPLLTRQVFHAGPGTLGALLGLLGAGAVIGGLIVASRGRTSGTFVAGAAIASGVGLVVAGSMPTLPLEMIAVIPLGMATILFVASANSLLQLRSAGSMRGRVMALYAVLFLGSTPVGAPLIGWLAKVLSVQETMAIAGGVTLLAGLAVLRLVLRDRDRSVESNEVTERSADSSASATHAKQRQVATAG